MAVISRGARKPDEAEEKHVSEQKRGRCPVCDRDMLLKKDGTLRHHGGPVGSGMWDDYRSYQCKGVGVLPVPRVEWNPTGDTWRAASVVFDRDAHLVIRLDVDGQELLVEKRHTRTLGTT